VEVNEIRDNPPPRREAEQQDSGAAGTIKVNTAGEEELMQLRGVNRILAKTIIAERNIGGYFTGIADLQKRIDLAAEQVERIRKNLDFEVPKRGGGRVIEY
jgi:DNA uptake protein ComE-like DNA-binding protein